MLKDLVLRNRSYRSFDEKREIKKEELLDLVEHARLCASSVNQQPLKYYLAYTKEDLNKIQPLTGWAKALKKELPYPGHYPQAFIVICQDMQIASNMQAFLKDVGIVAQTMLLRAVENKLGGCMIGNFNPKDLSKVLQLDEYLMPHLILAIGKPDETIILEDAKPGQNISYYRDEDDVHHVPKRSLDELIIAHEK
ncbi:nitroreductase family protein [Erysipelotrichaceae bacterium HCN-30851]